MARISDSKLLQIDAGILNVQDACVVLVKTEWNASIVDELEKGCIEELKKTQHPEDRYPYSPRGI